MTAFKLPHLALLCGLIALSLSGCERLPKLDDRIPSSALQDTAATRLGLAITPRAQAHPGLSGVFALADGHDAYAARALLAKSADRTLDVQYYIWQHDMSGTLLFEALHRAADRGVRVRLLLDDNNTDGLDELLAGLDAHPRIQVRLFNPFVNRRWRALGYLTDFARLNRRMHNKSFTADNQATIIGGRNVGDEYFGAGDDFLFADLDVLAIGPVVSEVSRDFDRYWASDSSYPADRLLPVADPARLARLATAAGLAERDPAAAEYVQAAAQSPFVRELLAGRLPFVWAPTRMISDDPAKGLGLAEADGLLSKWLYPVLGAAEQELLLVSPYFVPTAAGVEALAALAGRGVDVTVLTNALEATDVAAVHAGYAKRREALLRAGIRLFELKRSGAGPDSRLRDRGLAGSSASSLHAKTFVIDRDRLFIGSYNFDPRSARLNTEMGFVIDSPSMATTMAEAFTLNVPAAAYELRLDDAGELQWLEWQDGRRLVHRQEPGASFWLRLAVRVMAMLPIEWLL